MLISLGALGAAVLYAVGYLELKGSIHHGATSKRVNIFSNYAMAAWSMPLAFLALFLPTHPNWESAGAAVAAGASLFMGRICTVKALAKADLSISAPLLGTKTVLVALFSILLLHTPVGWNLLIAAGLTVAALALLQVGPITTSTIAARLSDGRWEPVSSSPSLTSSRRDSRGSRVLPSSNPSCSLPSRP
ncbi:MAG: EamA family transporter [Chthoniobacterales bacterium]